MCNMPKLEAVAGNKRDRQTATTMRAETNSFSLRAGALEEGKSVSREDRLGIHSVGLPTAAAPRA